MKLYVGMWLHLILAASAFGAGSDSSGGSGGGNNSVSTNPVPYGIGKEQADILYMPYVGDLDEHKLVAQNTQEWNDDYKPDSSTDENPSNGSIFVWDNSIKNAAGETVGGYVEVTNDGVYDGPGVPGEVSGQSSASASHVGPDGIANTYDDDTLILVGSEEHPIIINGVNVVQGDVILGGVYSGVGTIISGRNVHIISNLEAENPAQWDKQKAMDAALAAGDAVTSLDLTITDPDAQQADLENRKNEARDLEYEKQKQLQYQSQYDTDLIGLFAKGNVVLGLPDLVYDENESAPHLTDNNKYAVDQSDLVNGYGIGLNDPNSSIYLKLGVDSDGNTIVIDGGSADFPAFHGDYTAWDGGGYNTYGEPIMLSPFSQKTTLETRDSETGVVELKLNFTNQEDSFSDKMEIFVDGSQVSLTGKYPIYHENGDFKEWSEEVTETYTVTQVDSTNVNMEHGGNMTFQLVANDDPSNNNLYRQGDDNGDFQFEVSLLQANPSGLVQRKYYEPTIYSETNAQLANLFGLNVDSQNMYVDTIDALMYTNHLLGGAVGNLTITGAVIFRDEGIWYGNQNCNDCVDKSYQNCCDYCKTFGTKPWMTMNYNPMIVHGKLAGLLPTSPTGPSAFYIDE